jgi:carbon-monoxide dehydrogenase large subunit
VRSPVAHARLRAIHIPEDVRHAVFTAKDLVGVKPIISSPPLKGLSGRRNRYWRRTRVCYVGELVAMCLAATRAEAEDIAASVELDFEELPAVTDMLAALEFRRAPGARGVGRQRLHRVFGRRPGG